MKNKYYLTILKMKPIKICCVLCNQNFWIFNKHICNVRNSQNNINGIFTIKKCDN